MILLLITLLPLLIAAVITLTLKDSLARPVLFFTVFLVGNYLTLIISSIPLLSSMGMSSSRAQTSTVEVSLSQVPLLASLAIYIVVAIAITLALKKWLGKV